MNVLEQQWYYEEGGQQAGPVSGADLQDRIAAGRIVPQTLVWCNGMGDWTAADQTELASLFGAESETHEAGPDEAYDLADNAFGEQTSASPLGPATPAEPSEPRVRHNDHIPPQWTAASFVTLWNWYLGLSIAGIVLSCCCCLPLLAAVVLFMILQYRYWTLIQPLPARVTPGKAVGFQFIPFFNLYWVFFVYPGLAEDMTAYCEDNQIDAPPISMKLAWAVPSLGLVQAALGAVHVAVRVSMQFQQMQGGGQGGNAAPVLMGSAIGLQLLVAAISIATLVVQIAFIKQCNDVAVTIMEEEQGY